MATLAAPTSARPAPPPAASVELDYQPSYLAAGIAAALVLGLYLLTLAPSTAMWDASEYIAAAYVLGIPHPPGNPFFVLLGNVFTHLPIAPTVAQRVNVLAALCSALSAAAWFLITERVLVSWLRARWQRLVGAGLATLIGATAFTVWNQSVVNEKVYTVSLLFFAIVSWITVLWCDDPEGGKADRLLVLAAYLLGLGYANHPAGLLVAPAVGIAVLARRWTTVLRWKLILAAFAAFVLGLTPFLTQPIRAAHFPALNEGEPTACTTEIGFDCTFNAVTYKRLMDNVNREQYGKPELTVRQAPFTAQVEAWYLYFRWQWLRDAHNEHPFWQNVLGAAFLALGLVGGYVHWKRDRRSFWFFGPLVFSVTLALIYYMNFKYVYSQSPELASTVPREVRDRDYFYLWSFSAWGVWAALGLVYLWETLATLFGSDEQRIGRETVTVPRQRSWLLASPVLAIAFVPLFANWSQASRALQTDTRDFAHDLLNSVEPYGILVTVGDNDTFPLWYAQEVEGIRKDVVIANTSLLNTDWYTRQLIRRPVYEYDAAKGPALYRGQQWKRPTGSPLKMTPEQADEVPLYRELPGAQTFRAGTIEATVDPQALTNGVLERADHFVLQMIRDSYGERPMYFSSTSGSYGRQLGLGSYLVTQGLARRVMNTPPTAGGNIVAVPGEGFVDVARSKALWMNVFEAPRSLIRRGDWVDQPSVMIPGLYVLHGSVLAETLRAQGDIQSAQQVLGTTQQVAQVASLTDLLRPAAPLLPAQGDSTAATAVPLP
ncbi:MAG: putative membrane protein [uncultured Gemmatimonadaceae bacterium]|uniref:Putative membrane protein n=1 Tax=uncultured Gemmatimonadaceae bacterium TaxID=246130 RepID=A0A6J4M556_9BACT|nr:MAG: putative membrane protein [uncultured Gemmatimonadaceae bacterium]